MKVGDLVKYWGHTSDENDVGIIIGLVKTFPRQVWVQWSKETCAEKWPLEDFEDLCHTDIEVINESR